MRLKGVANALRIRQKLSSIDVQMRFKCFAFWKGFRLFETDQTLCTEKAVTKRPQSSCKYQPLLPCRRNDLIPVRPECLDALLAVPLPADAEALLAIMSARAKVSALAQVRVSPIPRFSGVEVSSFVTASSCGEML
jgi:hypothetical protein